MTCVGMLCVLLALATPPAARAQQGEDACHGASGDPTCHGAGADAAAVSLLQITAAIKTKTKEHQQVQERPSHQGPCSDSTTYADPTFGDGCPQWAGFNCDGFSFSATLKENCPEACKQCGAGSGGGAGAGGGSFGGGGGSVADQWVKAHNKYRCMHGIPYLTWNPTIAERAQAWGDQTGGGMQHSSGGYRENVAGFKYLGENLAWASPVASTPQQAVKMWYNEIEATNGGEVTTPGMAGHYTQVVWKASTDVGCGTTAGLNVCEYGPGGNFGYGDAYQANVNGPVKSEAECEGER